MPNTHTTRRPEGITVALPIIYGYSVALTIDWPESIDYAGHRWHPTRKEGHNCQTGLPAAEYTRTDQDFAGARVWLASDGSITED